MRNSRTTGFYTKRYRVNCESAGHMHWGSERKTGGKKFMYRVLLADDEQIERMALARRLMRRFGDILQISEATNGKEAVQLYEKEHSQIIIMDISMPELNGVEAAEKIRSMDEDCIIVFLNCL